MKNSSESLCQFARFPHRNGILGRESTPEEIAFLQQPGSSFQFHQKLTKQHGKIGGCKPISL
jgi:hypothetical protein